MKPIEQEILETLGPILRRFCVENHAAREPGFFLDLFVGLGVGAGIDDGLSDAQVLARVMETVKAYLAERAA